MDGVCLRASAKLCGDDFLSLKHVKTTWDVFQRLSKILKLNIIKYSGFSGGGHWGVLNTVFIPQKKITNTAISHK